MLCQFLLYGRVNQLDIYLYPHLFGFPSHLGPASLVAQLVENLPAMWETWVQSLGWKIPWRREQRLTLVFLLGEFHGQRNLAGYSPWRSKKSDMTN